MTLVQNERFLGGFVRVEVVQLLDSSRRQGCFNSSGGVSFGQSWFLSWCFFVATTGVSMSVSPQHQAIMVINIGQLTQEAVSNSFDKGFCGDWFWGWFRGGGDNHIIWIRRGGDFLEGDTVQGSSFSRLGVGRHLILTDWRNVFFVRVGVIICIESPFWCIHYVLFGLPAVI